ncbi:hypothetical protein ACO0LV_03030 [Pseudactinotalea sp. Z1739]|uniref:hypothetical protein n=1 Tax=Pseudactinotalea sp. Z1739 TaxID=3413028 RepID=UPI003C7A07AA
MLLALLGLIVATVVWFTVGREAWASFMDGRSEAAQEQPVTDDGTGGREDEAGDTGDGDTGGADDESDDTEAGSGPDPAGSGTEEPDEDALANPVQCRSDAIRVELDLGGSRHPAGEALPISVSVANTGPVPCLVDLGHQAMQVDVTSGEDEIWTTAQCPRGEGTRDLLLDIDARVGHTVTWNGQRCGSDGTAQAGTYRINVSVAGSDGPVRAGAVLELT